MDPFAGMLGALFLGAGTYLSSLIGTEHCSDKWINLDMIGLHSNLTTNVFGQHLMQDILLQTLNAHVRHKSRKALVLSFHGPTGTGKNLISSFIAKNLFKAGSKSQYHHLYIGSRDFYDTNLKLKYMKQLQNDVEKATKKCESNLFVFDEVDKMVPGVLDALSPYIDFYDSLHGVDYNKNIFIFMSNAGSNVISKTTLKLLEEGRKREDITLNDIEHVLNRDVYTEKGGLQNCEIVRRGRIDIYIPFLPMERKHIKDCIYAEMHSRNWRPTKDVVDKIADDIEFIPKDKKIFSRFGCRTVNKRVKRYYNNLRV